jgi:hypothetical protein
LLLKIIVFFLLVIEWRADQYLLIKLVVNAVPLIRKLCHALPFDDQLLVNLLFGLTDSLATTALIFMLILSILYMNIINTNATCFVGSSLLITSRPYRRMATHRRKLRTSMTL